MIVNDTKTITENLTDFIDVSDGIKRLRSEVLSLAVSGKLVPQIESEGTAEDLYEKIQEEKKKAEEKSGKRKKKELLLITDEEIPFDVPKSWKWTKLGEVSNYGNPEKIAPSQIQDGTIVVELEDIEKDSGILLKKKYFPERDVKSDKNVFYESDLLYGKLRPYLNKVIVAEDNGVCSTEIMPCKMYAGCLSRYFKAVLLSGYFSSYANRLTSGINLPRLRTEDGKNALFPLPPISEQKRIVEKVDELMKIIDELDVKKQQRDNVHSYLAKSSFHSLGMNDAKVAITHMSELVRNLDDVMELEKGILSLAVSGKLVPQKKSEGTAEELYKRIQEERIKEAKKSGKKFKSYSPVEPDEISFEIPESWKWVRLGELGFVFTGRTPKTSQPEYYGGDIDFIGPGDIYEGRIRPSSKKLTVLGMKESISAQNGDVLMVCIGGTIGKAALVKEEPITFNQQINKIAPIVINSTYLFAVLSSGYFQELIMTKASGAATPIVNANKWSKCLVSLPPVAEQKRIVERVNELMALTNQLKTIIKAD